MTVYIFSWWELALRIRDGSIATDLLRPLDLQRYWLAYDLGRAPYHFLFRGDSAVHRRRARVRACTGRRRSTRSRSSSALTLAVVVSFGFRFIYNSVAFWLLDFRGVVTRLDDDRHLLLRDGDPDPLLPGPAPQHLLCAAVRVGDPDTDRHLARQAIGARPRRRARAAARSGDWRCSASGKIVLTRATRKVVVQGG